MYRYANYKGYDISNKAGYSKFSDREAGCVSGYAKEAMSWAVGNGIITGKDNGTVIDPQGNAVRAECAAVIQRFITRYKN
ncbi:MAG: S-layer homology domain-containing protein [Lachnoclostridium sp.]